MIPTDGAMGKPMAFFGLGSYLARAGERTNFTHKNSGQRGILI